MATSRTPSFVPSVKHNNFVLRLAVTYHIQSDREIIGGPRMITDF